MEWKPFMIGAAVGLIGGYTVKEVISKKVNLSPDQVLEHAKSQFKQHGQINGSWIFRKEEPFEKGQISYKVYKGGISQIENGVQKQYEFIADAGTGTIIDVFPLSV